MLQVVAKHLELSCRCQPSSGRLIRWKVATGRSGLWHFQHSLDKISTPWDFLDT